MLSALPSRAKIAALWGLALVTLLLVPQSSAHAAQGSGSFGPGAGAAVLGAWYDTGVTIKVDPGTSSQDIQISDRRWLNVNMSVKVDNEEMWITALSGDTKPAWNPSDPDIMTVTRGYNGTTAAAHSVGAKVKAKVARVGIMVNNLTTPQADCDQDEWFYSGAALAQDMEIGQTSVQITQVGLLTVGLNIRIGSEQMKITGLNPTGPTMQVLRAQNGTTEAFHFATSSIWGETASPTPREQCGLGAYRIDLYYNPSNARYISLVNESLLGSTGRTVWDATGNCFAPDTSVSGRIRMECNSTGMTPQGKPIIGALGSGLVATALFEPLTSGSSISSLTMDGSFLTDIISTRLDGVSLTNGFLQADLTCPDATGDGWVTIGDVYIIAKNLNDRGTDSGATIDETVDTSQTTIQISGLGTLAGGDTIAVDFEQMHVNSLDPGPPATMEVERAVNQTPARTHQMGTTIWVASWDGNFDGIKGYTEPRDTNPRVFGSPPDKTLNMGDAMVTARVGIVVTTQCP